MIAGTHVDDVMCQQEYVDTMFQRALRAIGAHARRVKACVPVSSVSLENIGELQRRVRVIVASFLFFYCVFYYLKNCIVSIRLYFFFKAR